MSTAVAVQPRVLADVFPRVRARDLVLVLAAVALTAASAQIVIHVPGLTVPITGQTFAVLLSGAALGANRGATAMLLYIALGMIGLPGLRERHPWHRRRLRRHRRLPDRLPRRGLGRRPARRGAHGPQAPHGAAAVRDRQRDHLRDRRPVAGRVGAHEPRRPRSRRASRRSSAATSSRRSRPRRCSPAPGRWSGAVTTSSPAHPAGCSIGGPRPMTGSWHPSRAHFPCRAPCAS